MKAARPDRLRPDPLRPSLLARIALRSLLVQAVWNFERMQHLGFCFALLPLIRDLHPGPGSAGRGEALRRHLEFFNTHPVMAAIILGAVARLEGEGQGQAAQTCKLSLMGSYGAIGDSFFWGALRPAAGIAGVVAAVAWTLAGHLGGAALVAPLVTLLLYNVPALWLRAYGVFRGARLGIGVVEAVGRLGFPEWTVRVRGLGAAALGLAAGAVTFVAAVLLGLAGLAEDFEVRRGGLVVLPVGWLVGAAVVLAATLGSLWVIRRGVVPTRLAWLLAALALAGSLVT